MSEETTNNEGLDPKIKAKIDNLLEKMGELPEEEVNVLIDAIQEGKTNLAEAYGIESSTLDAMCQVAYSYYEAKLYDKAAPILGMIVQLDPYHYQSWRGLGALLQSQKLYKEATFPFFMAVATSSQKGTPDAISQILLGECMILSDNEETGRKVLKDVLSKENHPLEVTPYLKRAKVIMNSKGELPKPIVLLRDGKPLSATDGDASDDPFTAEDRDIMAKDLMKIPEMREHLKVLKEELVAGNITLAEVGGFAGKQMDDMYAVGCFYAEQEQYVEALDIISFLMLLDTKDTRYAMMAATIVQRMQNYHDADLIYHHLKGLCADDALYNLNAGETKIMLGFLEAGKSLLNRCLELADDSEKGKRYKQRAKKLLKLYVNKNG